MTSIRQFLRRSRASNTLRVQIVTTTGFAVLGRVSGFLVPLVLAACYGSTRETDVFFLVYGFVLCLMLIMGHLFEAVIVPHITDEAARGRNVDRLIGAILTRTTLILGLLVLAALPLVQPFLAWVTSLTPPSLELGFQLALLMAPMPLLMAWTGIFNGALNADKVFHVGALSPLFRSSTTILCVLVFHHRLGIYAVAWGLLLGEGVRLLVSLRAFLRRKHRLEPTWKLDGASTRFFASAAFQTVGFGLMCLIPIVNQITASRLEPGDLSIMSYALQLRNVPSLLFTTGLGTVVLSHWADRYSNRSVAFTCSYVVRVCGKLCLLAAACAGCLILLQGPIVRLALGWGAFPEDKLPLVGQLFAWFVLSLPFDVATLLFVRILIVRKSDVAYVFLSLLKLVLLIVLNALLVPAYGLIGIGVAMTVANALSTGTLFYFAIRTRPARAADSNSPLAGGVLHAPRDVAAETN